MKITPEKIKGWPLIATMDGTYLKAKKVNISPVGFLILDHPVQVADEKGGEPISVKAPQINIPLANISYWY